MRDYMFRSRWGALLFVGLTAAGAASIVGTGKGDGAIEQAKRQIAGQQHEAQAYADSLSPEPAWGNTKVEITPDEELIDLAQGEDPTPLDQRPEEEKKKDGEGEDQGETIILVSPDAAIRQPPGEADNASAQ